LPSCAAFLAFGPVAFIGFGLALTTSDTARVLFTSPRLRRATGLTDQQAAGAALTSTVLVAVLWGGCAAVLLPFGSWLILAVSLAGAAAAGALRLSLSNGVDFGSPALATPMGPTSLFGFVSSVRGIDMVFVVTLPVVLHAPDAVTACVAAGACGFAWFSATAKSKAR